MPLPPPDRDDDLLDELVRRSCRAEIDRQALGRLGEAWRREMKRRSRGRLWLPLAAAACVAVLAGTLIWISMTPRNVVQERSEPRMRNDQSPRDPRPAEDAADPPIQDAFSRPTPYERLVIQTAIDPAADEAEARTLSTRRHLIGRLRFMDEIDDESIERLTTELGINASELEAELAGLSDNLRGPSRRVAVELLVRVATRDSLPVLMQLWSHPVHQEQVASALARLADPHTLAICYTRAGSATARTVVATAIVERLAPGEVGLLVDLLTRSRQPAELVAALGKTRPPLAEALFAELDAERRADRFAAARALGALNRPDISQRLIELVASGDRRQEALVALASSNDPAAVRFVSRARQNAILATALQSALVQSSTSQPWYGG